MKLGIRLLVVVAVCGAEKWQWPEGAASVRIDTKVRFIDNDKDISHRDRVQADEAPAPFQEAVETEGFYNRPPGSGSGRYPVRVENAPYRIDQQSIYAVHSNNRKNYDGTLDSLQYCKCLSTPDCNPHRDSARACGSGRFLCCYKKPNKGNQQYTEFFNEIDDERPMLLPGQESLGRPFPPPLNTELNGYFGSGQGHEEASLVGAVDQGVLVGPQGPTGHIGNGNQGVLVGPNGPTGHIGPVNQNTGALIGPNSSGKQNPGVLVGPGGPTGIIGPANANKGLLIGPDGPIDPIHPEESAQRGVLVGPGGPTGFIGPQGGYGRRPVLVGPGGPTGIIGPRRPGFGGYFNNGYGRPMGRGVLVGPGGPTGTIGPSRGLLVGPGGPTGMIGPQGYFGK